MAAYEVLLLNTAVPQIQAAQAGDTYVCPRDIQITANLDVTGNTILGNASTDTVQVNGYMGVGVAPASNTGIYARPTALTGVSQYGVGSYPTATSAATTKIVGFGSGQRTAAASFTVTDSIGFEAANIGKGAGSTITNLHGVYIADQTQGTNNYGITSVVSSGTNKWNIYASGTAANYFAGNVGIGTSSPSENLDVSAAINGGGPTINVSNTYYAASSTDEYAEFQAEFYQDDVAARRAAGYMRFGKSGDFSANASASTFLAFATRNAGTLAERLRIDSSGNLGLGVTPSAWGTSVVKAIQVGNGAAFGGNTATGNPDAYMMSNCYYDGSNWRYITTDAAMSFDLRTNTGGTVAAVWQTAPSGTAGNVITFTERASIGLTEMVVNEPGADYDFRVESDTSTHALFVEGTNSNVKIGGSADRATTVGTNHLDIFNGTAPVGTLANGISIYSSSGEAYVMDAAGNATLFSPHDAETNEWIFKSKHTPTGKVLKIDVERLLKFVNDHFGLDAVHEFIED